VADTDDDILDLTERVDGPADKPEEPLLSAVSAAVATKAFGELAHALEQGEGKPGDITFDSGETLEDLVRDAVKPLAKDWLDRNLPDLVEDLVRSEIQRLVRRAKDG
jgi:cell pole-organizing protein PopZ